MRPCAWARGCEEWAYGDEKLCSFHEKKDEGLFDVPPSRPVDPLSSEGRAIGDLLHLLTTPHDDKSCQVCRSRNPTRRGSRRKNPKG